MSTYTDEYLEHYADRYVEQRLARHGVSLEQYLAAPGRYAGVALEPEPMLAQQRAVQTRLDAERQMPAVERDVEDLPRRNGTAMENVEARAEEYAAARDQLSHQVQTLERQIEDIKREHLPAIRDSVRQASEAHDRLRAAVEEHPDLWTGKRRTVVIAGVRVGMQKGKGKLAWDDAGQVAKLIRKHFPEQAEAMIRIKEEPIKKALGELSVAELRKIGVTVEDTDDQVVIKPTDSEVDKLVDKLLQDAERIEAEGATA